MGGLGALWWRDFSTSCGASLMIYGLFGSALSLYIARGRVAGDELRWRVVLAALWLIYGLITGYQTPGVDYVGHTSGLIAGLLLGLWLRWLSGGVRRRVTSRVFFARASLLALAGVSWAVFSMARPITPGLGGYLVWLSSQDEGWLARLNERHSLSLSEWREAWGQGIHGELVEARARLHDAVSVTLLKSERGEALQGPVSQYGRALDRYLGLLISGGEASVAPPPPPLASPLTHLLAQLRGADAELAFSLGAEYRALIQGGGAGEEGGLGASSSEALWVAQAHLRGERSLRGPLSVWVLAERLLVEARSTPSQLDAPAVRSRDRLVALKQLYVDLICCLDAHLGEGECGPVTSASHTLREDLSPLELLYARLVTLSVAERVADVSAMRRHARQALSLFPSPLLSLEGGPALYAGQGVLWEQPAEGVTPRELLLGAVSEEEAYRRWEPLVVCRLVGCALQRDPI